MQIKERCLSETFSFPQRLRWFKRFLNKLWNIIFTRICHNLTPVNYRARKKKKEQEDLKNNGTSLARTVMTMFSSKTVNVLMESIIHSHGRRFLQFLLWNLRYKCPNWTDLEDSPGAYICCRTEIKTSLALSLRTNCLRKFRY